MKIKITTKSETEIERPTPFFTSNGSGKYYAFLSDENEIDVTWIEYDTMRPSAGIWNRLPNNSDASLPEITQAEFEAAYEKANDYLSEQFEAMREREELAHGSEDAYKGDIYERDADKAKNRI